MRKASDIGSSDSFSGSVGKLAPGFGIKKGRVLEVDAAKLSKGRALTNPPSRGAL
jgi:hypothetical protein